MERAYAERLDRDDELGWLRDRFFIEENGPLYLDGNSLGRLPRATTEAVDRTLRVDWGTGLVRSWPSWTEHAEQVGDALGDALLGAAPGQVAISDSTTVNLYKLAVAALDARPGRRLILSTADNFPTDRYVLEGLAAARGLDLRLLRTSHDVTEALSPDVALVSLSHVSYRTAAIEDVPAITKAAHLAGALTLWDLCHSVGAVPAELDRWDVDLAVGCTYKYVCAGPGAPAFLYVRRDLQERLRQPIWGWFGQRQQFQMGPAYDPVPGIERFLAGTPPMLALVPVGTGVQTLAEAGIARLRRRSIALTGLLVELWRAWLAPLGFGLASPSDPARRGGHVALSHPEASRVSRALIRAGVVPDFRPPDIVRLCPAPAYTRFVEVWDAMALLRDLVAAEDHLVGMEANPGPVP